jgi:DNA end-binding protein Ku
MARAIWKGSVAFGLVNVPVELHPAVRNHRPRFRLLHAKDKSPVEYQRVCREEGKPVAWEDLVKGYEVERGRYVVLTKEDFETAALERSRTVDVLDFVNEVDIDDRFFESSYFMVPSRGAEHAYAVLREALQKSGKVGIGRVILRNVQHLASVGAVGRALVLTLMRFADELVDVENLSLPSAKIDAREIKLAESLIEHLTSEWEPTRYTDQYQENLMRVIKSKLKGKKPKLMEPEEKRSAEVIDLMSRLRASLERSPKARAKKTTRRDASRRRASGRSRSKKRGSRAAA